ncbi:unnamed protein product [Cuscuta europaea]|uniref:Uncharacterized protein n=1 Tax=Cuscuta europaea TaxID=41803 RepID=A0A9P0YYP5_CUSEU|nr:unnamed protein product [Cuscuta europaea]
MWNAGGDKVVNGVVVRGGGGVDWAVAKSQGQRRRRGLGGGELWSCGARWFLRSCQSAFERNRIKDQVFYLNGHFFVQVKSTLIFVHPSFTSNISVIVSR